MAYLDDKLEIAEASRKSQYGDVATARLELLMARWGCQDDLFFHESKAPPMVVVHNSAGEEETWRIDGDQPGVSWKKKLYKRVK